MKKILILLVFAALVFTFIILSKSSSLNNRNINLDIFSNPKGQPLYATGNCNSHADCFASGCSSQVCSNHEVITTCEEIDFPEKETYSCGCVESRCVWFR